MKNPRDVIPVSTACEGKEENVQKLEEGGIGLQVSDVSQQKMAQVTDVPRDSTVGELVQGLLDELKLPQLDVSGRTLTYHALLQREGRHVHAAERVGDALQPGDSLTLQPNIDAGR
jgi:hypothetical protein